jgi:hypothetical protein
MYSNPLTCIAKIMFDAGGEHNILENSDWSKEQCTEVIQTASLRSIAVIDQHIKEVFGSADSFDQKDTSTTDSKKSLDPKTLKELISKMSVEEKEELKKLLM